MQTISQKGGKDPNLDEISQASNFQRPHLLFLTSFLSLLGCIKCPLAIAPNPVCGSDGITYWTLCWLEFEKCEGKPDLTVAYQGECQKQG